MSDCVFCRIVDGCEPSTMVASGAGWVAIVPLNPVVDGHLLVIPRRHVEDFTSDREATALVAEGASVVAGSLGGDYNLITSKGSAATQTVMHLHMHLVSRVVGDGLRLPWC